jgi:hypothetical protein
MMSEGDVVLERFRGYFSSFMDGSIDELAQYAALPFFELRGEELTELRSVVQLDGYRRGLRAQMVSLGYAYGTLKEARVAMADHSLAIVQFENTRNTRDGAAVGGTHSLAFLRCDGGSWRVWMITVVKTFAGGSV